jgi:hypothetical protein
VAYRPEVAGLVSTQGDALGKRASRCPAAPGGTRRPVPRRVEVTRGHLGERVRASAGTMISAATRWLIDRTTMVAVVASLARGSQKETIVPTTASATNHLRGRGAHRWQAAAAMVPTAPPSNRVASTNECTGMGLKWSLNTSVNSRGTPARRATTYRTVLAAAAINAATRPTCHSGRLVHAGLLCVGPRLGAVVSRLGARGGLLGASWWRHVPACQDRVDGCGWRACIRVSDHEPTKS